MKPLFISCILMLALANFGFAQTGDAGSTGMAFLKLGVGGRATAMGEAYSAVADDPTATFWNPAGLSSLKRAQLAFTHTEWISDIATDFLAFATPALGGTIGLSFYTLSVDGIERRTSPTLEALGNVNFRDLALGLSYARSLGSSLNGGITVKYLYEKIHIYDVTGFAVDLGLNFRPFENPLQLAVVLQNLGSMNELLQESTQLPTTVRVGAAYVVVLDGIDGALVLAADGVKDFENDIKGSFGAEFRFFEKLALRFGYQTGFEDKAFGGGFGLHFNRINLDYGYTPFDSNLGDTHKFSFRFEI